MIPHNLLAPLIKPKETKMRCLPALALALLAGPALAHGGHDHGTHPPQDLAPIDAPAIITFTVAKAVDGGFTVTLQTENFAFVSIDPDLPAHASGVIDGQATGHAHLYINGTKLAEMEGPVLHLPEMPFGPHDFRAVLGNPAHSEYAILGRVIAADVEFTVD